MRSILTAAIWEASFSSFPDIPSPTPGAMLTIPSMHAPGMHTLQASYKCHRNIEKEEETQIK